jgi:predicted RecA/RadA family phage recombinase
MATNYVQPGNHLTVTAPAALSSGDPVLIGERLFGVAQADAESGASVVIATEGVWTLPKVSVDALSVGNVVFFDALAGLITIDDDSGANPAVGLAVAAAGNPSATVNVKIGAIIDLTINTGP